MPSAITHADLGLPPPLEKGSIDLGLKENHHYKDDDHEPQYEIKFSYRPSRLAVSSQSADGKDADEDKGSIIYINCIPKIPQADKELKKLQKDNELASSFWSAKATESSDIKVKSHDLPDGSDPDSIIARDNYRIKVTEYAIQHSGWMSLSASQNAHKHFRVKKSELHWQLINTVLSGLLIPTSVYNNFEQVLTSIGNTLQQTKSATASQNKWIILTTYRWDDRQQKIFTSRRTIYFSVTQGLIDYNNGKHDKGTDADVDLFYKQDDWDFNQSVWKLFKDDVKKWLKGSDHDIDQPIDIPV